MIKIKQVLKALFRKALRKYGKNVLTFDVVQDAFVILVLASYLTEKQIKSVLIRLKQQLQKLFTTAHLVATITLAFTEV